MKRVLMALVAVVAGQAALPGTAGAWLKFTNNTPNTISTTHAFSSTSGIGCGWDDGCSGSRGDWRIQGWWNIAPGGTATVQSSGYGNAYHDYYAEDSFGHVWDGGGGTYCTDSTAFDRCSNDACVDCQPQPQCGGTHPRVLTYRRLRGSRCCGGSCPSNYTLTFVL